VARRELSQGVYIAGDTIFATVGRAIQLEVERTVSSVIIANPDIVREVVAEPRQVFLVAEGVGTTNIFMRDEQGRVIQSYNVIVEADMDGLRRALLAVLPENQLSITATQSGVVLSGQVRSAADAANAATVAGQFVGSGGAVVNSLNIAGDQQVLLRVRVAEMNRTARKFLATDTNFNVTNSPGDTAFRSYNFFNQNTVLNGALGSLAIGATTASVGPLGTLLIGDFGISDITFSTLEDRGLIRLLAEPALTAISGETANFLAGGEFPVYSGVDDQGRPIIAFKEFGVKLSFTPVALSDNNISLRISTEVSRIAEENSITLGNYSVPGLSTRRAESTIMLPSGGSLMIAGLLQTEDRNAFQGIPGLMDLPILGALFRSQDFRTDRSELVITVQAFKVRPREFGPELALPTDGFVPADDLDMYLLGNLHKRYGDPHDEGGEAPYTVAAPIGYIME